MEQQPQLSEQEPRFSYEQALEAKQRLVDGVLDDYQNLCGLGYGVSGQGEYRKVAIRVKQIDAIGTAVAFTDQYIPGVPVDIEYIGEVNAASAVEIYARTEMAHKRVLTWYHHEDQNKVSLYVPNDVDISVYPNEIAGVPTEIIPVPPPTPFGEGDGEVLINYNTVVRLLEKEIADNQPTTTPNPET